MARISLRGYIQKIEILVDRGETDQAIFHCKSILKTYPKHIDSYRLLGKAFLEKKKFGDAADIFQRVLSSIPDDFISQIGMSIIKEDENNLDAAIWHMERAFETQPSNKAVQEELRRLYSARDGVAPPKIRLTRGALVRMYVKGELYTQASAEILAALSEDPNRIDLEVILARLYFLMGQNVEATEVCSKLISRAPYCYEANIILAEILPGTTRAEDSKIFLQRTIELDPYMGFIDNSNPSASDVSDDAVMIDFVEWDPSQIQHTQVNWSDSIGVSLTSSDNSEEDEIEEWFNFEQEVTNEQLITNEIVPESTFVSPDETIISDKTRTDLTELLNADDPEGSIIPDLTTEEEISNIPDWIKEAGWDETDTENVEAQKGFNLVDESKLIINEKDDIKEELSEEETVNIEPGEIPEWLQKIAPIDQLHMEENEDVGDENDEAFEKLFAQISSSDENKHSPENKEDSMDWLNEFENEFSGTNDSDQTFQSTDDEEISEIISLDPQNNLEDEELIELSDEVITSDINDPSEERIENIEDESAAAIEKVTEATDTNMNADDLLDSENTIKTLEPALEESESDMAWLEALSDNQGIDDSPDTDLESGNKDLSEWIKELDKEFMDSDKIDNLVQSLKQVDNTPISESIELPDWLNFDDQEQTDEAEPGLSENLRITNIEGKDEPMPTDLDMNTSESSQWLNEMDHEESIPEGEINVSVEKVMGTVDEQEPLETVKEDEELIPGEQEEIESALTWMENLAIKHNSTEDSLNNKLEDKDESPPDWLKSLSEIDEIDSKENAMDDEYKQVLPEDQINLTPDWLQALQIETDDGEGSSLEEDETTLLELEEQIKIAQEDIDIPLEFETEFLTNSNNQDEINELTDEIEELILDSDEVSDLENEQLVEDPMIQSPDFEESSADIIAEIETELVDSIDTKSEISEFSKKRLDSAKQAINKGRIEEALEVYNEFIHAELVLDQVINDLQEVLNTQYPIEVVLWQALGDAQLRNNQLQEALDSYSKAEELL